MGLPRQRRAELPRSVPAASSRVTGQVAGDRGLRHPPPKGHREPGLTRGTSPWVCGLGVWRCDILASSWQTPTTTLITKNQHFSCGLS